MIIVSDSRSLDCITTTKFAEKRLVWACHTKTDKDGFVSGMPCTKRTDYKTKDGSVLALGDVMVFQVIILGDIFLFRSSVTVAIILKRAGDVNYWDLVVVDNHNREFGNATGSDDGDVCARAGVWTLHNYCINKRCLDIAVLPATSFWMICRCVDNVWFFILFWGIMAELNKQR